MLDILKEYGFVLLQLVLEALLPVLAVYVIRLVKAMIDNAMAKLDADQAAFINEAARIAVLAAEQMHLADKLIDKKDKALEIANGYLIEHGYEIDLAVISDAIEAAVMSEFNQFRLEPVMEVTEG